MKAAAEAANSLIFERLELRSEACSVTFDTWGQRRILAEMVEVLDRECSKIESEFRSQSRPKMLMVAFACDPHESMEHRNGWYRAIQAAHHFDVTVLCGPECNEAELNQEIRQPFGPQQIQFKVLPTDRLTNYCLNSEWLFYVGYRRWLNKMYLHALEMEKTTKFAASHLVSLCGYREPGRFWKLSGEFIWGPIGGTSGFPLRYLTIVDFMGGMFELVRNVLNARQLWFSRRIRTAISRSSTVISANRSTQQDLRKCLGTDSLLELEAGIDFANTEPKETRTLQQPLRILWAGRLRAWKGLPLLLHALAKLPRSFPVEVRIMGDGVCKKSLVRLARRLKIDHQIDWIERPHYRESLAQYKWADVFVFTSLRDTSGTGLLESLAMGVPIIGLDHQGASDIMTDDSAIRVSVRTPSESIQQIADAILKLTNDPALLKRLSDGAGKRGLKYMWHNRGGAVDAAYERLSGKLACS